MLVPAGPAGDALVDAMRTTVSELEARVLLNGGISVHGDVFPSALIAAYRSV